MSLSKDFNVTQTDVLEALSQAGLQGPPLLGKPAGRREQDVMEMQLNIRNNNKDLQSYVDDLNEWQKEVSVKDKDSSLRDPNRNVSQHTLP